MLPILTVRYLEMAIKESLRMHPAVPFTMRVTTQPVNILGHDIPSQVKELTPF
jgi:cytochrome P450